MHLRLLSRLVRSHSSRSLCAPLGCAMTSLHASQTPSRSLITTTTSANDHHWKLVGFPGNGRQSFDSLMFVPKRSLAKKKGGSGGSKHRNEAKKDDDDDESDEDEDDEDEGQNDSDIFNETVSSLRMDNVARATLKIPRAQVEQAFYEGRIRVNGQRVNKKSSEIHTDDVLDYIRGFDIDQRDHLCIDRVDMLHIDDKAASRGAGRTKIQFKKTRKMVIPNYTDDPYEV